MNDVRAEILPLGKLRLIPGVQYRVLKEFTDDTGTAHPVGERWSYAGCEQPKMYPGYVVHCLQGSGGKLVFRLRWGVGGQPDVVHFFERYVTGPVVPIGLVLCRLSPDAVAALERVRHWIEPLPNDSNALLNLIQARQGTASRAADEGGPTQPSVDLYILKRDLEAALKGFDA